MTRRKVPRVYTYLGLAARRAGMTESGLNNASGIVWATGMSLFEICFFCFSVIFRFYLSVEGTRKAVMTQTGPNDARRVVWAVGIMSFFSFRFFCILTDIFCYI